MIETRGLRKVAGDVVSLVRNGSAMKAAALGPGHDVIAQPIMLIAGVLLPIAFAPLWLKRVAWPARPFARSLR